MLSIELSYKRKPEEKWIFCLETENLLVKFSHVLKREGKILIENILFINNSFNNLLPPIFKYWVTFCSDVHNYQTVSSTADEIFKLSYRTDSDGKKSITIGVINSWNKTQHQFSNLSLKKLKVYFLKSELKTINEEVKRGKYN